MGTANVLDEKITNNETRIFFTELPYYYFFKNIS